MEKQHAYKKIEKDLKECKIKNVLLLYGREQYLVKWSVDMILKKYVNDEYRTFDFFEIDTENATVEHIIENCETFSMFSEKRVVYLPNFTLVSGGKLKKINETDEKKFIEYLKEVPDTCIFVISAETTDKRKKLYKELVSCGNVYDFGKLDERSLRSFIEKRFASLGK